MNNLIEYFKRNLKKGYTSGTLRIALINQGYSKVAIEEALKRANSELAEKAPIIKEKPVIKYDADPNVWEDNVEFYLLQKSKPKFYNDKVVRNGYCRGKETVKYVREIFERYEHYKKFIE